MKFKLKDLELGVCSFDKTAGNEKREKPNI